MEHILEPTSDTAWVVDTKGYDPLREGSVESRFAISNGFLGVRGGRAATRGARWRTPARTYVAGLFDTLGADHAVPGLVPAADWLQVRILLAGRPLLLPPRRYAFAPHDPRHEAGLAAQRRPLFEGRRPRRPCTDLAPRFAQRACDRAAARPVRDRRRSGRDHARSVVRGHGSGTRSGADRTCSRSVAHPAFG